MFLRGYGMSPVFGKGLLMSIPNGSQVILSDGTLVKVGGQWMVIDWLFQ